MIDPKSGRAHAPAAPRERVDAGGDSPAFVEHLLKGRERADTDAAEAGRAVEPPAALTEGDILSWSEGVGTLTDGRAARAGFSCVVRPASGDRVLIWPTPEACWVLAILQRPDEQSPAVIAMPGPTALEAPRIALSAKTLHIAAGDLLTSAGNVHSVSDTSTESSRLRVTQVGTDIRRVGNADEKVEGTLLQRMGTWMSATVREARLTARSFLFN